MHDPCLMGMIERLGNAQADQGNFISTGRADLRPIVKRNSAYQVTDDIHRFIRAAHFMHGNDVGVFQLSGSPSLAQKFIDLCLGKLSSSWQFQRNRSIKYGVAGFPDSPETADTNSFDELKMRNLFEGGSAFGRRRIRHQTE